MSNQPLKELDTFVTIRFQDCDPFGHLNNARYVDYFLNTRSDQVLEHYGIQIMKDGQTESWVVNKSQMAYFAPAKLSERVLIRTRLIRLTDRTILVEGLMLNEEGRRLKAVLWMEFTYVSLTTGRPVSHPGDLQNLFDAVLYEDGPIADFDQRLDSLRMHYRRRAETPQAEAA